MMPLQIVPVVTPAELDRFIALSDRINAGDPNYVPPLRMERREALSPKKNPFFAHADVQLWLAIRDGRDVGRISAQIDHMAPPSPDGPHGHFGLICAEDDAAVFAAPALHKGYDAIPTSEGISRATTETVVTASLAVLGFDFILTAVMFGG